MNISLTEISLIFITALTTIITGCSSSDSESLPDGTESITGSQNTTTSLSIINAGPVLQLGTFEVEGRNFENPSLDSTFIEANFLQSDQDFASILAQQVPDDSCEVARGNPELANFNFMAISAGDAIIVSSPEGTFSTLTQEPVIGGIVYSTTADVTTPLPTGLTLDIPGDTFPAFANVAIPNVNRIENFNVDILAETAEFTWTASADPNSFLQIDIAVDISPTETVFILCTVDDDGSFQVPAESIPEIESFTAATLEIVQRIVFAITRSGDALLSVTVAAETELAE